MTEIENKVHYLKWNGEICVLLVKDLPQTSRSGSMCFSAYTTFMRYGTYLT